MYSDVQAYLEKAGNIEADRPPWTPEDAVGVPQLCLRCVAAPANVPMPVDAPLPRQFVGPSKDSKVLLQMLPELEAFRLRLREHGVILDGDVGYGGMGCVWR